MNVITVLLDLGSTEARWQPRRTARSGPGASTAAASSASATPRTGTPRPKSAAGHR